MAVCIAHAPIPTTDGLACDLIKGTIYLDVKAYKYADVPGVPKVIFYRVAGGALLNGSAGAWLAHAWPANSSRAPLWNSQDFSIDHEPFRGGPDGHLLMELINPRTYHVNLSSVDVGESFTVLVETYASTYNRAAGAVSGQDAEFETAVNTWLRDPATIGGTTVTTTGLTPIATPLPLVEPVEPVEPAPCVPGPAPDPAAGVIQFSEANYFQAESRATPTITVSRTGGSTGAVTATFTTSNGSATAGADYTAVNTTVFFGDGDAVTRTVEVPIIQDLFSAEPDRTVNLTLSQPGGCAALGSQTTAVLVIRDDDATTPTNAVHGRRHGHGLHRHRTGAGESHRLVPAHRRQRSVYLFQYSVAHRHRVFRARLQSATQRARFPDAGLYRRQWHRVFWQCECHKCRSDLRRLVKVVSTVVSLASLACSSSVKRSLDVSDV